MQSVTSQAFPARALYPRLEVARILGVGKTTLDEMIADKRLAAKKIGRKTLVTHESLMALLSALPAAELRRAPKIQERGAS